MVSSQERHADGGLSGQWTPGGQVTTSRRGATSMPRPVQLASSKSGMETNRGCAGEVILQPLNVVLLGTAITSEESTSPPTPL